MAANELYAVTAVTVVTRQGDVTVAATEIEDDDELAIAATGEPGYRVELNDLPLDLLSTVSRDPFLWSSVTVLNLTDCRLGSVPNDVIKQMENLVFLRIDYNEHLQTLPAAIGYLRHLVRLSVFGNRLKSLPSSFAELKTVKVLRLGGNRLKTEDLRVVEGMTALQRLYL